MVYQQRVGLNSDSGFNLGQTRRHTRYHFLHMLPPLHLQAVGAVVFEAFWLKKGIQRSVYFLAISHGGLPCRGLLH